MQVVIDIDENLYTRLFNNGGDDESDIAKVCTAVRGGTPLPLNEYENIIDKYGHNPSLCTKKIDKWCIHTMRGIIGEHYADLIHKADGGEQNESSN